MTSSENHLFSGKEKKSRPYPACIDSTETWAASLLKDQMVLVGWLKSNWKSDN